jgi:PKD repeat protein
MREAQLSRAAARCVMDNARTRRPGFVRNGHPQRGIQDFSNHWLRWMGRAAWTCLILVSLRVGTSWALPNFTATPLSGPAPLAVTFTPVDIYGTPNPITWDFGDGGSEVGPGGKVHTYTSAGSFTVTLHLWYGARDSSVTKLHYVTLCAPPPSGMISWWPGDQDARDIYGNNGGTLVGGATLAPGFVDNAFSLDGIDDYIEVPDAPSLNFGPSPGGDLSIDTWISAVEVPGTAVIVDKRVESGGGIQGYSLFLTDGKLSFQIGHGGGPFDSYLNFFSNVVVADGTWHFITVTVDRDNTAGGNFYLDGNPVPVFTFDPTPRGGSLSNTSPLRIGNRTVSGSSFFQGLIDEVEIFDRVLSPSEVQSIYAAGSNGKCKCSANSQGDLNGDGMIDVFDVIAVIDAAFSGGTDPQDPLSPTPRGDVNNDGAVDVFDVIYLIDTAFSGGPNPVNPCAP